MTNNLFELFLCDENGRGIKDENGKHKTVIIQAEDLDEACEIFSQEYPGQFWDDYMEFESKNNS